MLKKITNKSFFIFLFILFFSNICIYCGTDYKNFTNKKFFITIFLSFLISIVVYLIIEKAKNTFKSLKFNWIVKKQKKEKIFLISSILHILCYSIILLSYYPGVMSYDVQSEMTIYSTHHSLLHSFYISFFYNQIGNGIFHNATLGIALASFVQIIIFSLQISFLHLTLYKLNINRKIRYIILAFTILFPVFSILSISHTKDIIFSSSFLMLVCLLVLGINNIKIRFSNFYYLISIAMIIALRNNGIYAVIPLLIALFINKKKMLLYQTMIGLAIGILIIFSIKVYFNAQEGSKNEMYSIPYQQISYVYNKECDNLDDSIKSDCEKLIPYISNYDIHLADEVKRKATGDINFSLLIKTYVNLGIRYPVDYINAFLQTNSGYLYLLDISTSEIYGTDRYDGMGYLLTFNYDIEGIEYKSKIPQLKSLLEKLFVENEYIKIIPLRILCEYSIYIYCILLVSLLVIKNKFKEFYPILVFTAAYFFTLLLGPCALTRYALPFILIAPLLLFAYIVKKEEIINSNYDS